MYFTLLGFFIFKLQTTVAQFPSHTDLQKVGEVIFNNEKYNVLKPTVHDVTDYFKDFMLRRENADFLTKRVFIDHNGFRHSWSGFGNKVQSLRKTDLKNVVYSSDNFADTFSTKKAPINVTTTKAPETTKNAIETNIEQFTITTKKPVHTTKAVKPSTDSIETTTDTIASTTEIIKPTAKSKKNIPNKEKLMNLYHQDNVTESEESVEKSPESVTEVPGSTETSTLMLLFRATVQSNTSISVTASQKQQVRQGKQAAKQSVKPRAVAKTTFFCPFFGVITMSAFVD